MNLYNVPDSVLSVKDTAGNRTVQVLTLVDAGRQHKEVNVIAYKRGGVRRGRAAILFKVARTTSATHGYLQGTLQRKQIQQWSARSGRCKAARGVALKKVFHCRTYQYVASHVKLDNIESNGCVIKFRNNHQHSDITSHQNQDQ